MDGQGRAGTRGWRLAVVGLAVTTLLGLSAVTTTGVGADPSAATAACTAPAWSSSAFYRTGDQVTYNGHQWRANQDTWPGLAPGAGVPPWWVPWTDLGPCGSGTTTTTAPPSSTTTTSTPGSTTSATVPSAGDVEDHFTARGPWAVTTGTVTVPGATTGPVMLFYPTNLGAGGTRHPIITDAAGTGYTFVASDERANQLASWGFVVAGISSPGFSGEGAESISMRATADYLIAQNGNSSSTFFGKLATNKVGVMGHSQGAVATLLTVGSSRNADRLYTSAATLSLPDRSWWAADSNPNYSLITNPTTSFWGTSDFLSSAGEKTFFYNSLAGPTGRVSGVGKDHNNIISASKGYLVAWFKYTLEGDQFARRAFVGSPPQIATNPDWTGWAAKNVP